jgi:hypothetical protein
VSSSLGYVLSKTYRSLETAKRRLRTYKPKIQQVILQVMNLRAFGLVSSCGVCRDYPRHRNCLQQPNEDLQTTLLKSLMTPGGSFIARASFWLFQKASKNIPKPNIINGFPRSDSFITYRFESVLSQFQVHRLIHRQVQCTMKLARIAYLLLWSERSGGLDCVSVFGHGSTQS